MFDAATTALLRSFLDEVCRNVATGETGTRTHVASKILKAARQGELCPEQMRQVGRDALSRVPSMWL